VVVDATAPDVIRHAVAPPDVPGPYESEPYDMAVTGRDIRIVHGAYTDDPDAPVGPPTLDAWVRFRDVPHDSYLHAALLARFTGHLSIAAALRPHEGIGQRAACSARWRHVASAPRTWRARASASSSWR
jgi:acyl-CoA thioesterase II